MSRVKHFRLLYPETRPVLDWLESRNTRREVVRQVAYQFGTSWFFKISIEASPLADEFESIWGRYAYKGEAPDYATGPKQRSRVLARLLELFQR